jgi:hypothetical protein
MTTAASQTYQTQTAQIKNARRFVKRNLGQRVYIAYGTADVYVEGFALDVNKDYATIQHAETGDLVLVPLWAITEASEA